MTANEYQKKALRTVNRTLSIESLMADGALGLCGEAGEAANMIKKALYQEHPLDIKKLMEELGDTLWYMALLCDLWGWTLEDIMVQNISKLERRFPDGEFSGKASRERLDTRTE